MPFIVFEKGHLFAIMKVQIKSRDTLNLVCYANLLKTCWRRSSFLCYFTCANSDFITSLTISASPWYPNAFAFSLAFLA